MIDDLSALFVRDLERTAEGIEAYDSDEALWEQAEGISNPGGNLALHLEGNLKHFIGSVLGNSEFERDRDHEFNAKGCSREELAIRLRETREVVKGTLEALSPERLDENYPIELFGAPMTVRYFLIHLYGHLDYHRGQMEYHRRILGGLGDKGTR